MVNRVISENSHTALGDWFNHQRLLGQIARIPSAEAEANQYATNEALDLVA